MILSDCGTNVYAALLGLSLDSFLISAPGSGTPSGSNSSHPLPCKVDLADEEVLNVLQLVETVAVAFTGDCTVVKYHSYMHDQEGRLY